MIHASRRARHEQVSDSIVDAAERVLVAHGVEGCTIARVAAEVGCTPGALYRYHPSKEALLGAVTARAITQFVDDVSPGLDDAPGGPEGAFVAVFRVARAWAQLAARRPAHARLLYGMLADPSPVVPVADAATATDAARGLLQRLAIRLDIAAGAGALRVGDPVARLVALWSAAHGATTLGKLRHHGLPIPDDAVDDAIWLVLVGLGADPAAASAARAAA